MIDDLGEDSESLHAFLSSFSCEKDEDIQSFLHNRAIEFERVSKSRTFLIVDGEQLTTEQLTEGKIEDVTIYGYVSLAIKSFTIPENVSNRKRRELDGFSAKSNGEPIQSIPCYLIGQLSKNSAVQNNIISGADLIDLACGAISQAVQSVGGRYIMIECRNAEKLISFYRANGFSFAFKMPDDNAKMIQMLREIDNVPGA